MELDDGTIIPSFLSPKTAPTGIGTEYVLRSGIVTAAYDIDDPRNQNKKFIEYDVDVSYNNGGGHIIRKYHHVIVSSLFGGKADYIRWAPRVDVQNGNTRFNNGSVVLLLCVNGNLSLAYIVGGVPNPNLPVDEKYADSGLKFEYNGVNVNISKDGELTLIHKGATNLDGTVKDTKNGNAQLSMFKDGKISIGYATSEGDKPQITWDKQDNSITIHGDSKIRIEANNGPVEIETSSGVKINEATEAIVRGTTYREKQTEFHNKLIALFEILANQHKAAGAGMAYLAAGPIVTSMATTFEQMESAVKAFEAESDEYLSKKHFHED